MDPIYEEFNKKWKVISKIVLGEEVGELADFKKWLTGSSRAALERKSSVSGKNVHFVLPYYSDTASFASMEEVDMNKKFEPLDINQLKDMDSIIEAVKERIAYTGNLHLGESKFLSKSTDIVSSSYVYNSAQVAYSKWIAFSYNMENCEYPFGCQNTGFNTRYSIKCSGADIQTRCLEVHSSRNCQDCYYSNSLYNTKNCLFSFGLRNAVYCVGNLQLTPNEYSKVKKKILEDIVDELKSKKTLPELEDFFVPYQPNLAKAKMILGKPETPEAFDKDIIEDAFRKTTRIIFGKELSDLDKYGFWLKKHTRDIKFCKSVLSGERIIVPEYSNCYHYPENRLVTMPESVLVGKNLKIDKEKIDEFDLKSVGKIVNDVAFFNCAENFGVLKNNIESEINISCQNFYKSVLNVDSRLGAFNFHGLYSEYLFGTYSLRKSAFCIRCYLSENLARCFEVDSSRSCSDCYFCHNCENVREGMFCFNVKNLNYAIGNVELPKEEYMAIKRKVLDSIANSLENEGDYRLDVFNLVGKKN
ncbi:MAG: hypothetical protein WCT31_00750 [Candidatus Micrarchaeia archaeon]|jgi:hypothetical protein